MTISLIASVCQNKDGLAIGKNEELLFVIKKDLKYFSNITSSTTSDTGNVVVMGRKTYFSIPEHKRPLKNRFNIVLTTKIELMTDYGLISGFSKDMMKYTHFMTFGTFKNLYDIFKPNVFVIGGYDIYSLFLRKDYDLNPDRLYITDVKTSDPVSADTYMPFIGSEYQLVSYSKKYKETNTSFRFLIYKKTETPSQEYKYLELSRKILDYGNVRTDRTGTGTRSLFGVQLEFDIMNTVPMMTTKKLPFKSIVEELLWFCRGDTDSKILEKRNVNIWKKNTSKSFLLGRGLDYREGVLGPGYGWQLRHQGEKYSQEYADTSGLMLGGFDQLSYVLDLLKTDPFSRRIMFSFWNPCDFEKTALLPCHVTVQFYVDERNSIKYLSCHFTMRSNDIFLGNPFNIMSYTILTYILALKTGMVPDKLVYSCGDAHIYNNHIQEITTQLNRKPFPQPSLSIDPSVKNKDWKDIEYKDFELIGYFSHPYIKADMAI